MKQKYLPKTEDIFLSHLAGSLPAGRQGTADMQSISLCKNHLSHLAGSLPAGRRGTADLQSISPHTKII